jgi:hypothetical protein
MAQFIEAKDLIEAEKEQMRQEQLRQEQLQQEEEERRRLAQEAQD